MIHTLNEQEKQIKLIDVVFVPRMTKLNEYINAERSNKFYAAKIKKSETEKCMLFFLKKKYRPPLVYSFVWMEPNMRYDFDNIVFAKKFIFDGMQKAGAIENDGRKYVNEVVFEKVIVDKKNPGVEIGVWQVYE